MNGMTDLLKQVYCNRRLTFALKTASYAISAVSAAVFVLMTVLAYLRAPYEAVLLILVAGVPFFAVSGVRSLINAPRPYEVYKFYETAPRSKCGKSMPSRHVFSAMLIAVLSYTLSLPLAIVLAVLAVALGVIRVLLGIHFIRDVAVGCALGLILGTLGTVILTSLIQLS